jgi:hypothetical protein
MRAARSVFSIMTAAHIVLSIMRAAGTLHAEGLVNPKVHAKKRLLILDTPEHVDSEKPNRQIDSGPPLPTFFKT